MSEQKPMMILSISFSVPDDAAYKRASECYGRSFNVGSLFHDTLNDSIFDADFYEYHGLKVAGLLEALDWDLETYIKHVVTREVIILIYRDHYVVWEFCMDKKGIVFNKFGERPRNPNSKYLYIMTSRVFHEQHDITGLSFCGVTITGDSLYKEMFKQLVKDSPSNAEYTVYKISLNHYGDSHYMYEDDFVTDPIFAENLKGQCITDSIEYYDYLMRFIEWERMSCDANGNILGAWWVSEDEYNKSMSDFYNPEFVAKNRAAYNPIRYCHWLEGEAITYAGNILTDDHQVIVKPMEGEYIP